MNSAIKKLINIVFLGTLRTERQQAAGAVILSLILFAVTAWYSYENREKPIDAKYIYNPNNNQSVKPQKRARKPIARKKESDTAEAKQPTQNDNATEVPNKKGTPDEAVDSTMSKDNTSQPYQQPDPEIDEEWENAPKDEKSKQEKIDQNPMSEEEKRAARNLYNDILAKRVPQVYAVIAFNRYDPIAFTMYAQLVPNTVANFVGLAMGIKIFTDPKTGKEVMRPFYDGISVHRVIRNFVIQTGDPLGTGYGGPGYFISEEYNSSLRHYRPGIISMANSGNGKTGSQFFFTLDAFPSFDRKYTIFGKIIYGMDTLREIEKAETDILDRPVDEVIMTEVKIFKTRDEVKEKIKELLITETRAPASNKPVPSQDNEITNQQKQSTENSPNRGAKIKSSKPEQSEELREPQATETPQANQTPAAESKTEPQEAQQQHEKESSTPKQNEELREPQAETSKDSQRTEGETKAEHPEPQQQTENESSHQKQNEELREPQAEVLSDSPEQEAEPEPETKTKDSLKHQRQPLPGPQQVPNTQDQ